MARCSGVPLGNTYNPLTHPGIDYDVPQGTPVYAPDAGSVQTFQWNVSYGYHVVWVRGLWSIIYAHLSMISVPSGYAVAKGQVLGHTGCTGHCTGPHLHFEVHYGGVPIDPDTVPCPLSPNQAGIIGLEGKAYAVTKPVSDAGIAQAYVAAGYTPNGVLRKYKSRCLPPSGGGFWSHIPVVNVAAAGVKDTSYAICVMTDVNTYLRLAMIVFGSILLVRGTLDFSKVLNPAFAASIQSGVSKMGNAAKMAVAA